MAEMQLMNLCFQGSTVRMLMKDGQTLWVAKDVCDVLQHSNSRTALDRLDDDEKGVSTVYTLGGPQEMAVVTQSGLYSLILTSRLPKAKTFKRWVTREVLPSIQKHGMYATDALLDDPEHLLKVTLRLVEERRARRIAEEKVKELEPKGEFYDKVADATNLQYVGDVAKQLDCGPNKFFAWLRGEKILMDGNVPYQRYIDEGYFEVKARTYDARGENRMATTTFVTGRGFVWLQKRWAAVQQIALQA